jgi:hypothetical protein
MIKQEKIKQIVNLLNEVDIDAETMEDILHEVGLREQVLHQVLESEKYITAKKVWDDFCNNETLIYDSGDFSRYYTDKFLS